MKPHMPKSLVLDIYGAFVRDLGGWIAISHLVSLMDVLGYDESHTRMSVSRFCQRDLLERRKREGTVGYQLTPQSEQILAEGDDRIFGRLEPSRLRDGWTLITFSIPESIRAQRHQLRSRLTWLGFGSLGGGAWIAPRRMLEKAENVVIDLGLEDYVDLFESHHVALSSDASLASRCWDLDEIGENYVRYSEEMLPVIDKYSGVDPDGVREQAFADYVFSLHEWRKLPFRDPGLPAELLPADWAGKHAADIFRRFQEVLEAPARRYVVDVVSG